MFANHTRAIFIGAALGLGIAPATALGQGPAAPKAQPTDEAAALAAIRTATERFKDVSVALAEGYIADPSGICITAEMEGQPKQLGAMGVHYLRPDLLGITATEPRVAGVGTPTDFMNPSVLVYEPQADGSMRLVAIENLVWAKAWAEAGNTAAPSFMGHEYYYMHDNPATEADEAHGFEPHYELHMWLYLDNPAGMFMPFNTASSCANAKPHAGH